jgi:hypothetical protein
VRRIQASVFILIFELGLEATVFWRYKWIWVWIESVMEFVVGFHGKVMDKRDV